MSAKHFACFIIAALFSSWGCDESAEVNPAGPLTPKPLTMVEVYHYPITDVAQEEINLRTKLTWYEGHPYDWWTQTYNEDTLLVSHLSVFWEEADEFIPSRLKNQDRGNIFVVSLDVHKEFNEDGIQEYFFQDRRLSKSTNYVLVGQIEYRDWMSPPPLGNPKFIEQSNNPVYWRQTFQFRLIDIYEIQ